MLDRKFEYDAFICHASEDKDVVARPLAVALTELGCNIWYDEMVLTIGDNLKRKIEEGLSKSRFGIVVLSPAFFGKQWPQYELDGLLSREMADAIKIILPVRHNLTSDDVRNYSAPLSVRLSGDTSSGIEKLACELVKVLQPKEAKNSPKITDNLSLCKQAILTEALEDGNRILINPPSIVGGRSVVLGKYGMAFSERQRKLFLYALDQLENAMLVERLSDTYYELTYLGIEAAERMERLTEAEIKNIGLA